MKTLRRETKKVSVGKVAIGGKSPITIQSMTNTDTKDIYSTTVQMRQLVSAG